MRKLDETTYLNIEKYIANNIEVELKNTCCSEIDFKYFLAEESFKSFENTSLEELDKSWQERVFEIIDEKGFDEPEVYKTSNISRQTFSKIRSNKDYQPNKDTAIQMCFGLKLSLEESQDLLSKAGYTLSKSITRDLVFMYFIEKKIFNVNKVSYK